MDPTSSTPSFPWEIFNLIIEELVEDPDILPQEFVEFNTVKQCAVVCKGFTALCQPYIFRIIDHIDLQHRENKRTKNFMHVMQSNPNLSHYVRHLHVESLETQKFTSSRDEVSDGIEVLKGFPNLIKLHIENYADRPGYMIERKHPQYFYDDLRGLASTYLYQGSLRSLKLLGLENWPVDDVFSCSTLREFGLGSLYIPSLTMSAPHITRLTLQNTEDIDLGVLCSFPNLEELSTTGASYAAPLHRTESAPSFGLRVLYMAIDNPGELTTLLDFYNDYADMTGVQPFRKLEELEYRLPVADGGEVEAMEEMLQTTSLLKVLTIDTIYSISYPNDPTFPLARLQLASKILDVFPHLTTLNLRFNITSLDGYNELMTEISNIFVDIECKNVIETVTIMIEAEARIFDSIPSCEPWSRISRSLSSCAAYPKLTDLFAQSCVHGTHNDVEWLGSHAKLYMSDAMKEVVARQGVTCEGKMVVRFTYDGI